MNIKLSENLELSSERILIELDFPLLFSCRDNKNNLYIVMCIEDDDEFIQYLVIKSSDMVLKKMLTDKITIRELFTDREESTVWYVDLCNWKIKDIKVDQEGIINEDYLPSEGVFFENEEEFVDYIKTLTKSDIRRDFKFGNTIKNIFDCIYKKDLNFDVYTFINNRVYDNYGETCIDIFKKEDTTQFFKINETLFSQFNDNKLEIIIENTFEKNLKIKNEEEFIDIPIKEKKYMMAS